MFRFAKASFGTLLVAGAVALPITALTGCDPDEEVLEVETPESELEVERDRNTGELEVENE